MLYAMLWYALYDMTNGDLWDCKQCYEILMLYYEGLMLRYEIQLLCYAMLCYANLCLSMLCYDCTTFVMAHVMTFLLPELLIHDLFNTRFNVSGDILNKF